MLFFVVSMPKVCSQTHAHTHRHWPSIAGGMAEWCWYFKGQTMLFVCPGFNGLQFLSSHVSCRQRQETVETRATKAQTLYHKKKHNLSINKDFILYTSELQIWVCVVFSIAGMCLSLLERICSEFILAVWCLKGAKPTNVETQYTQCEVNIWYK